METRKAVTLDDISTIAKIYTCKEFLNFGILSKYTSYQALLTTMVDNIKNGNHIYYICKNENEAVAAFNFAKIDWFNKNAEIHIVTSFSSNNSKIFYLVAKKIIEIAFQDYDFRKIYGDTPEWNNGLLTIARLLGGCLSPSYEKGIFCDGVWQRTVLVEIFRETYDLRRRKTIVGITNE